MDKGIGKLKWLQYMTAAAFLAGALMWSLPELRRADSGLEAMIISMTTGGVIVVGACIGLVIGTVGHELGHWYLGRYHGMRTEAFELFGRRWCASDGRWRRSQAVGGMLGGVAMQPTSTLTAKGLIAHYRGGYTVNSVLAGSLAIGAIGLGGCFGALCLGAAIINGYLAWMNALPLGDDALYTDGDMIRLIRSDESAMMAMMQASGALYAGVRPSALIPIRVDSDQRLIAVSQAMLAFLQASDRDDAAAASEVIELVRERNAPVLNIDPIERRAYAVIYDSWLAPNTARLYAELNADFGLLKRDDRPMSRLARFFERCYRYEHRIAPVPTREAIEADSLLLLELFGREANVGMAIWACDLIRRRELGINRADIKSESVRL